HAIYEKLVRDRDNGLLAKNTPEGWFSALEYLITHPQEREKIRRNAFNDVAKHRVIDTLYCQKFLDSLRYAIKKKKGLDVSLKQAARPTAPSLIYKSYQDLISDI